MAVAKMRVWKCPTCGHHFEDLIKDEARDVGTKCPICEESCKRENEVMTAPNLTRASRVDGSTSNATKQLIEASKLESQMFNMPHKKRGEIKKEIQKLKSTKAGRAKIEAKESKK